MEISLRCLLTKLLFLPTSLMCVCSVHANPNTLVTVDLQNPGNIYAGQSTNFVVSWTETPPTYDLTPPPYPSSFISLLAPFAGGSSGGNNWWDFQSGDGQEFSGGYGYSGSGSYGPVTCSGFTCGLEIPVVYATPGDYIASIAINSTAFLELTFYAPPATRALFDDFYVTGHGFANVPVNVSPVPEPKSYALLMAGLGFLGVVVRRRKQNLNA